MTKLSIIQKQLETLLDSPANPRASLTFKKNTQNILLAHYQNLFPAKISLINRLFRPLLAGSFIIFTLLFLNSRQNKPSSDLDNIQAFSDQYDQEVNDLELIIQEAETITFQI